MLVAAAGSLAKTGSVLRRCSEEHSLLSEASSQWLRTGLGQLATYGKESPADLRRAADAPIAAAGVPAGLSDVHCGDEAFFKQLDPDRPEMCELANCIETADRDLSRWQRFASFIILVLYARRPSIMGSA